MKVKKIFYTKADTIINLKNNLKYFKIPKSYLFFVYDWNSNKSEILKKIKRKFNKKIIIRSSSTMEDTKKSSAAGKFISIQNVNSKNTNSIKLNINKVINSYKKYKTNVDQEQILIQEMILNVKMSGVIFTGNNANENYYYTINYDDITGTTDTITSGKSEHSNKILNIYKNKKNLIRSERFKNIIKGTQEIEKIFGDQKLDIEFCQDKNDKFYLFQVRPLVINNKIKNISELKFYKSLKKIKKQLKKIFIKDKNNFYGSKTILSQMSDWNPAEMIGQYPSNLSFSLYSFLITKKNWLIARKIFGYKYFNSNQLMTLIGGRPFIDVRKSLLSFLPNNIDKSLSNYLINKSVEKLMSKPSAHDKIEFELIPTCFSFDIEKRYYLNKYYLKKNEVKNLKKNYKDIFLKSLISTSSSSIDYNLKKIEYLKKSQNNFLKNSNKSISDIKKILHECIKFGIIPFSILARHGFVAKELLFSLVRMKLIDEKKRNKFEKSINTIASEFLKDQNKLSKNHNNKKIYNSFMKKYGHLRPGTYDIKSKRYDQINKSYFFSSANRKIKNNENIKFKLSKSSIDKIDNLLKYEKVPLDSKKLFQYIVDAIRAREYAKFIFSKNISLVLEKLKYFSKTNNIKLNDLEYLDINDFFKNKIEIKKLKKKIYLKKNEKRIFESIKLPEIIVEPDNAYIGASVVSVPNFVTKKKVEGKAIFLSNQKNNQIIKDKIVLIESADPGFDWIFGHGIKALITKFGGANSHMTIRCSELNIPAAIGCGEGLFSKLSKSKWIGLNCENMIIRSKNE